MKVWTDAGKTKICYVLETKETAVFDLTEPVPVNQAEYIALLRALHTCVERGIKEVEVYTDSQVVAYQMTGRYKCKAANLKPLRNECYKLLQRLDRWSINWIGRAENEAGLILDRLQGGAK